MQQALVRNRYLVVPGLVLMQLALGAIYAWSVFTPGLVDQAGPYAFSASQTQWIFTVGLVTFALVMVVAGKLLALLGPRGLTVLSAITLGMGYIYAGLEGDTFLKQLVLIGVVGGAGIGLGYVVPIATGVKWFPDKKGLVTGVAVAGFGFGAAIWVKLAGSWFGGLLHTTSVFNLPGIQSVFFIYGCVFMVLILLGSIVMVYPPEGWKPEGWTPPVGAEHHKSGGKDLSVKEMLHHSQFYLLVGVFLLSAMAGLMVIGSIKLFGIDVLQLQDFGKAEASAVAGTAMAWYAIWNGIGRIAWGALSDRIGRKLSVLFMTMFQGTVVVMTYHVFVTLGHDWGFIVVASIIGFNFGGNFALIPAWTADLFGNAKVGANYPFVFLAYGIAGIAGPLLAGYFKDSAQDAVNPMVWMTPFIIASIACFLGAVLAALIRPIDHK